MLGEQDLTAIRSSYARYIETLLSRDFERWSKHYTQDAVVMPDGQPDLHGRDAIVAWAESFPEIVECLPPEILLIDGAGDIAYVRGIWKMSMRSRGPKPLFIRIRFLEVRRRQPDGTWPVAVDIWNEAPQPGE